MASPQSLLVGRPGDLIPRDGLVDAYSTRIGGTPVLPLGQDLHMPDLACPRCEKLLVQVLQTHAPVTAAQAGMAVPERFLFLLGCTTEECPGSWRVLRCQLAGSSLPTEATSGDSAGGAGQHQVEEKRESPAATDSWGDEGTRGDTWGLAAAADWGAATGGGWEVEESAAGASSAFDFEDLNAALDATHSAMSARKEGAAEQEQRLPDTASTAAAAAAADATAALKGCYARPCLPSFYLLAEPEPQPVLKLGRHEREHLQQLLEQYEQKAGMAPQEDADADFISGRSNAAATTCMPSIEGSSSIGGSDTWAGEGYEPDAVLRTDKGRPAVAADVAFLKFAKRLAACPDQCARYSFGGAPIWPTDRLPAPQACGICGAPAVFELQLMAPAIHYLEESADWLEEAGDGEEGGSESAAGNGEQGAGGTILRPPHSWEWATVAVYSCSRSCSQAQQQAKRGGCFVEEQVFVGNE